MVRGAVKNVHDSGKNNTSIDFKLAPSKQDTLSNSHNSGIIAGDAEFSGVPLIRSSVEQVHDCRRLMAIVIINKKITTAREDGQAPYRCGRKSVTSYAEVHCRP